MELVFDMQGQEAKSPVNDRLQKWFKRKGKEKGVRKRVLSRRRAGRV